MAGLQLVSEKQERAASDKTAWLYCFRREPGIVQPSSKAAAALRDSCLVDGDMVMLSIEGLPTDVCHHVCVKQGATAFS